MTPQVDCGRYPGEARRRRPRRRARATSSATATRCSARRSATGRPARRAGSRRRSSALGNDRWAGLVRRRPAGHAGRSASRRGSTGSRRSRTSCGARSTAGQADLDGRARPRARSLLGRETLTVEEALAAPAGDRHGTACVADARASTSTASSRASARGTSSSRARGAASTASRKLLPQLAELGFDVVYLPPIHPIGRTNRKGRNNTLDAGPNDPGSPWAIGSEEGGHDAIHPELGTLAEFERLVAEREDARHRDRARLRDPVLARPPVAEGSIRSGSTAGPTARSSTPRTRRSATRTSTTSTSTPRTGRASGRRSATSSSCWVERGVTVFRVDNPHTKPVPFWEWLIAEVRRDHPDVIFLAEAFTRPAMMTTLAQGRLRAELHVLHVEEHALGAARVHGPAARLEGVLPAELVREHARHPPRVPRSAAAGPRSRRASSSRRRCRRRTASTRASRASRTCRCARGARSTSTRRSTR